MQTKVSKNLSYGLLALLFLLLFSTLTVARSANNIYPLTNYFAFNEDGVIKHGVNNETLQTESSPSDYLRRSRLQIKNNSKGTNPYF